MKEYQYKILNPGGNITALVIGNQYTSKEKQQINDEILQNNPLVEQVGFVSKNEQKLEMAGGEFCVNATRCAIWEYLKGNTGEITLQVSGIKETIKGGITDEKEVYAIIPINQRVNNIIKRQNEFHLISIEGILIAVVDEAHAKPYIEKLQEDETQTKLELKEKMKTFKTDEKAVGIIVLEEINNKLKIHPVIWVKTVNTLYYETACGSGSLAATIYKNSVDGLEELALLQPSGYELEIVLDKKEDWIQSATVMGKVIEEGLAGWQKKY